MTVSDPPVNRIVTPCVGATMALADDGFRDQNGVPDPMTIGKTGAWQERMGGATAGSLVTVIGGVKRIRHRRAASIQARLAVVAAMGNARMDVFPMLHPDADPSKMSIAEFSR